ncbi:MAG TPA: type II toxin-antitoxin system death-on-curing family toxin, partial [Thermomicrobiales bacterium]|nr:type II toxin-antitoxin system death-on-curing family toxin [Thermomicrobiales bacterium]
ESTGGTPALRDEPALASATMRPQMAARYEDADLVAQAVRLITGIALAHAFVDGNKRAAFITGVTFLRLNGLRYTGDPIELAQQIEAVLTRTGSLEDAETAFAAWLRVRVDSGSE